MTELPNQGEKKKKRTEKQSKELEQQGSKES
jgi:hypothetical protein